MGFPEGDVSWVALRKLLEVFILEAIMLYRAFSRIGEVVRNELEYRRNRRAWERAIRDGGPWPW